MRCIIRNTKKQKNELAGRPVFNLSLELIDWDLAKLDLNQIISHLKNIIEEEGKMPELLQGFDPNKKTSVLVIMNDRRRSFYCLPVSETVVEVSGLSVTIPVYEQVITTFTGPELERVASDNPGKGIYVIARPAYADGCISAAIKIRPEDIPDVSQAKKSLEKCDCVEVGQFKYYHVNYKKLPCFRTEDNTLSDGLDLYLHESEPEVQEYLAQRKLAVA